MKEGSIQESQGQAEALRLAEEKVGNLELELEDCKEQEMMMPGVSDYPVNDYPVTRGQGASCHNCQVWECCCCC